MGQSKALRGTATDEHDQPTRTVSVTSLVPAAPNRSSTRIPPLAFVLGCAVCRVVCFADDEEEAASLAEPAAFVTSLNVPPIAPGRAPDSEPDVGATNVNMNLRCEHAHAHAHAHSRTRTDAHANTHSTRSR